MTRNVQPRGIAAVISGIAVEPSQRLSHMIDDPLHPHRGDQRIVDDGHQRAGRREASAGKAEDGGVQRLPEPAMDEHEDGGRRSPSLRIEQVERRVRPCSIWHLQAMPRRRAGLRRQCQPPLHDLRQGADQIQRELRIERGAIGVVTPEHGRISRGRRGCFHNSFAARTQPAHELLAGPDLVCRHAQPVSQDARDVLEEQSRQPGILPAQRIEVRPRESRGIRPDRRR